MCRHTSAKANSCVLRILSPSCAGTRGGTAKLFLHSFYWQLLLKVTHISRGAEFQEGGKKKKRKKKAGFLCNFSLELAGAQESCSSQTQETRTQPQPHALINTRAENSMHTVTLPPTGTWMRCRGNTLKGAVHNEQPNGPKDGGGREGGRGRILLCCSNRLTSNLSCSAVAMK